MTRAETIVANEILDALTRTILIDSTHAVLLTATPSNDRRSIAVRVEPFEGDEIVEVQVLVSPARVVTHDAECPNGVGTMDEEPKDAA